MNLLSDFPDTNVCEAAASLASPREPPKMSVLSTATRSASHSLLMPELISPDIADTFLRMLWRDLINQDVLTQTHQDQLLRKNALEIHGRNYAPLLALHWGLTSLVAEKTAVDLLPSFSFFRLYFGGDICRVHADRPACEFSVSLALAHSDELPWPLSIAENPATDRHAVSDDFGDEPYVSHALKAGDGIFYHGSRYRHGRITPNPNRWSAHVFLQWVKRDGPHRSEVFERLELGTRPFESAVK
jgi:hypothetical protein